MCGIAGVVGLRDRDETESVARMCDALRHRGPDAAGFHNSPGAHLGMRRLAVIDVAAGQQPFRSEDGRITVVFNGEIYNHAELRRRLQQRGHTLVTGSDTEVIPHLYEEYGARFVDHLDGMFAIALWDEAQRTLVLARDRTGKKPLFYTEHNGELWFGSELKSLLAVPDLPADVDPVAVDLYLTYQYVPHPWTIFRGIRKLPPAHTLTWRDGRIHLDRYWSLQYPQADPAVPADPQELAAELREHLLRATRIRMPSDRPLGAFLSGGLDSAAVVAAMAQQSSEPVRTFSIGFTHASYDELPHARRVADLYGTVHHELVVEPDIEALLPRLARGFDEPFADSSAVPSYALAEMAARDVVVALTGDGGDESFGGYGRYPHALRLPGTLPPRVQRMLGLASRWSGRRETPEVRRRATKALQLAAEGSGPIAYARLMSYFETEQRQRLYRADFAAEIGDWDSDRVIADAWHALADTDPVNRLLGVDVATYLPGDLLPKVDITTMMHSLEARSPLLDTQLMQWAAALPGSLKVHGGATKVLLKQALAPWLPADLIHRPKQGFGIPREEWLAGPLREMCGDLLGASEGPMQWFDPHEVRRLQPSRTPDPSSGRRQWALMMLQLWWQEVVATRRRTDEQVIRLPHDEPAARVR